MTGFIPEIKPWIDSLQKMGWDHLIASVHSLMIDGTPHIVNGRIDEFRFLLFNKFNGDMKKLSHRYFKTLQLAYQTGWFDFACHLDVFKKYNKNNIYLNDQAPWYREQISQTLDILKQMIMSMEINTAGLNQPVKEQYPSKWIRKQAIKRHIPIHLSSDSHHPDSLGQHFDEIDVLIKDAL